MSACLFTFSHEFYAAATIEQLEEIAEEHGKILEEWNNRTCEIDNKFESDRASGYMANLPRIYKELYLRFKEKCK